MSLVPVARTTAAPHHDYHRRHLAAEFERDYDASSGRQTQHRREQEHWDRGRQHYQRVLDEWTCHAPGERQCHSSRLEATTVEATPSVHGQHRRSTSWRQKQHTYESSSHHVRQSTRVTSSSMRLIETRVTASSSSSVSHRTRAKSSNATAAEAVGGNCDGRKIDRSATTNSAFVNGITIIQSSSTSSHHERGFLAKEAGPVRGPFGHHAPWGASLKPSSLPESFRSSSSGSSTQKDDLLLAITDLEVSAPLNHAFQLGKKNLSQKGSLSRRRRPSRSNLKANMSEIFPESYDTLSREAKPEEADTINNNRKQNYSSSLAQIVNGARMERKQKTEGSNKKANSPTSLNSSSHIEKTSANGEMLYSGSSSRDPDLIRDVKLSQNSALHNPSHQRKLDSGNWLTEAKRNLRKSSSSLFSATSPTVSENVDATNRHNRKHSQEHDIVDYHYQRRSSSENRNSSTPAVNYSNTPDLKSPRLLAQSQIIVGNGSGNPTWRVTKEKSSNLENAKTRHSETSFNSNGSSTGLTRRQENKHHQSSSEMTVQPNKASSSIAVGSRKGGSSTPLRTTLLGSCDQAGDKSSSNKINKSDHRVEESRKSMSRVEMEREDITGHGNVANGKRSSSVSFPKPNATSERHWETTSQSFNNGYRKTSDKEELHSGIRKFPANLQTNSNGSNGELASSYSKSSVYNGNGSTNGVNGIENGSKSVQDVRESGYSSGSNRNQAQSVTFLLQDTDGSETDGVDTEDGYDEQDYGSSINMMDLEDEEDMDRDSGQGGHSTSSSAKHLEKNKSKSTSNLDDDETIEAPWFRNSHYRKPEKHGASDRQFAKSSMNLKYVSKGPWNRIGNGMEGGEETVNNGTSRVSVSPSLSPATTPAGVAPWIHEVKLRTVTPPPPFLRRPGSQSPSRDEKIAPWEVEEKRRRGYTLRSRVAEYGAMMNGGQVSPPVTVNGQKCTYEADSPETVAASEVPSAGYCKPGYSKSNLHERSNHFEISNGDNSATKSRQRISNNLDGTEVSVSSTRSPISQQPPINITLVTTAQRHQPRPAAVNGNDWNFRAAVESPDSYGDAIDPETRLPVEELERRNRVDWTSLDRPKTESVANHVTHHWLADIRLRRVAAPPSTTPSPAQSPNRQQHDQPLSPASIDLNGSGVSPPPASMDLDEDEDDLTDEEVRRINRPDTPNGYGDDNRRSSEPLTPSSVDRQTADDRWSAASSRRGESARRPAVVPRRADSVDEITPVIVRLRSVVAMPRESETSPASSSAVQWPRLRPVSITASTTPICESRQATLEFGDEEDRSPRTPNSSFDSDGNWRKPGRRDGGSGLDSAGTPEWVNEAHEKRRSWANLNQIDFEMSQRAASAATDQSTATKPPWLDHVAKLKKSVKRAPLAADGSSRESSTGWKFVGRLSAPPPPLDDATSTSIDDEDDTADERSASSGGGERRPSSHTPDSQRTVSTPVAPPPFDVESYVRELIARRKMRGGSNGSPSPGGADVAAAADADNWLQMSLHKTKTHIDWNSLEKSRQSHKEQHNLRREAEWLEAARSLRKSPRLARMTTEERRIVACLRPVEPHGANTADHQREMSDANGRRIDGAAANNVNGDCDPDGDESTEAPYDTVKSGLKRVNDEQMGHGDGGNGERDDDDPAEHQPEWLHTFTAIKKVNAVDWTKLDNGGTVESNGQSASSSGASGTNGATWLTQVQLRATGAPPEARVAKPPTADSSFRLTPVDLKPVVACPAAAMPPTAATLASATTNGVTSSTTTSTGLKRVTFYIPKARSSPELREEPEISVERKEPEHPEWVKIAERKCSRAINWEQLDKPQDSVSRSSRDSSGKWITQVHLKHVPPPLVAATVATAAPSGADSTDGQPSPPPQLRVRLRHVEPHQRPSRPPMTKSMSYDIGDLRRTAPPRSGATSTAVNATNGNGLNSAATDKTLYSPQLAKRKLAPGEETETPDWMKIAERKRQAQVDWDQLEVSRSSRNSSTSTLLEGAPGSLHDSEDPEEAERSDVFLSLQTSNLATSSSGAESGSQASWLGRTSPGSMRWQSEPQLSAAVAPPSQPSWLLQLAEKKRSCEVDWNNVAKDPSASIRSPGGTTTTTWLQEVRLKSPSLTRLDIGELSTSSSNASTANSVHEEQDQGDLPDGEESRPPASLPWSTGHAEVDRWQARYKDLFDDLGDEQDDSAATTTSGQDEVENGDDDQKGVNHYCLSPFRKSLRTTSLENRQKRRMEMYQRHYSLPDLPNAMPRSVSELEIIQLERPEVIPETAAEDLESADATRVVPESARDNDVPIVFVKLRHTDRKPEVKLSQMREISPAWLTEIKLRKTETKVKDNSVRGRVLQDTESAPTSNSIRSAVSNGSPKVDIRQSPTEPEPPSTPNFADHTPRLISPIPHVSPFGSPYRSAQSTAGNQSDSVHSESNSAEQTKETPYTSRLTARKFKADESPDPSFMSIRDTIHRDLKLQVERREKRISKKTEENGDQVPMTPHSTCQANRRLESKEQGVVFPGRGKPVWLEELKERKVALRSVSVENLVSEVAKSQRISGIRDSTKTGSPPHRAMRHSFTSSGSSINATLPSFDNVLDQIKSMGKGQLFASLKRNTGRGHTRSATEINNAEEMHEESSSSSSSSSKSSSLEDSEEHSLTIGCFKAETIHHTSFIIPPEALHSSRPASRSPSFTISHSENDFSIIINENPEGEEEDPNDDFLHRRGFSPQRPASVPPSHSFSGPGSPRFMPGGVRRSASDYMSPRVISTIGKLQALNEDAIANRDELKALISKGTTTIPLANLPEDDIKAMIEEASSDQNNKAAESTTDQELQSPMLLRNMMSSILSKACSDTNLAAIGVGRTTSAKTRFEVTTNRMHASCSDLQSPVIGEDDSNSGEDRTNSSELGNSISEQQHLCRSELYIDVLPLDCQLTVSTKNEYDDQNKADDDLSSKEESSSSKEECSSSSNKEEGSLKDDESSGMSIEYPSPEFTGFVVTPTNGSGKQYTWTLNGDDTPKHASSPVDQNGAEFVPSSMSQSDPFDGGKCSSTAVSTTTTTTMLTENTETVSEVVVEEISETFHSSTATSNNNCMDLNSQSDILINVDFES